MADHHNLRIYCFEKSSSDSPFIRLRLGFDINHSTFENYLRYLGSVWCHAQLLLFPFDHQNDENQCSLHIYTYNEVKVYLECIKYNDCGFKFKLHDFNGVDRWESVRVDWRSLTPRYAHFTRGRKLNKLILIFFY